MARKGHQGTVLTVQSLTAPYAVFQAMDFLSMDSLLLLLI